MKKLFMLTLAALISISFTACNKRIENSEKEVTYQKSIVPGFAQIGAESDWRTANSASIINAAASAGIQLKFENALQLQENQLKAIRKFIANKVDYIAFSPVAETGWDDVLKEAKLAGIPVIILDRAIRTENKVFLVDDEIVVREGIRDNVKLL